jgi:3-oxoacyl-[acyl-carrier protein] reductase
MKNLNNKKKIALITGASKGVGFGIMEKLAASGVNVVGISRDKKNLLKAQKIILKNHGVKIDIIKGDVSNLNFPKLIINKCIQKWGRIDILVNNTGGPPPLNINQTNGKDWNDAYKNNLMSVVNFIKYTIPYMKKNKWGRILTISSTVAKEPPPSMVLSASMRAGVIALNKAVSVDLAQYNINSNVLCLGGVLTERLRSLVKISAKKKRINFKKEMKIIEDTIPAKRFATPSEIANTAAFLLSEDNTYVTGQSLTIDGGLSKSI